MTTQGSQHDDPFLLSFSLPSSSHPSSSQCAIVTSTFSLLAPHLPPSRPRLPLSTSWKQNLSAPTSSASSATSSTTLKTRSARKVYFSPTPLPSLQASPKHKRPYATFLGAHSPAAKGQGRESKRRRNVYSGNPLLEAMRRDEMDEMCSGQGGSPASSSSDLSSRSAASISPATSVAASPAAGLLPPLRTSALRVSSCAVSSPPTALPFSSTAFSAPECHSAFTPPQPLRPIALPIPACTPAAQVSELLMPFSLPGLKPQMFAPLQASAVAVATTEGLEAEDATDSETESEVVSSLLLPTPSSSSSTASHHVLPILSSLLVPTASSSSSTLSSSPLPSPSRRGRPPLRTTHSAPASISGLKSILKLRPVGDGGPTGVGATAKNEREGSRRNGRGRRHVLGWEDCKVEAVEGQEATGERQAPVASGSGSGSGSGKSRDKASRRSGAGGGEGEKKQLSSGVGAGGAGGQPPSSSSSSLQQAPSNGARIVYAVQPDDPVLLRTPLLTIKASLRPASAVYVRADEETPLLPRSAQAAEQGEGMGMFETPTFLSDVEESYVLLTQALFRIPAKLTPEQLSHTLSPFVEMRVELLAALRRDIGNIVSFPSWVASQPLVAYPSVASSSRVNSPSSSPPSSPSRGKEAEERKKKIAKGKSSLTEEQMRRMRDELRVAQAAVKCVAAIGRDERIWGVLQDDDFPSLLRLVCTLPLSASKLSPLVQRDLFPFIPFVFSSLTLPASLLSPLFTPSLLPALKTCLTLPARTDRYRLALSESLNALSHLISLSPRNCLSSENWRIWFRAAVAGLWEGSKKGVSTRERAIRVVGRVVRGLTVEAEIEGEGGEEAREWVGERERVGKELGREMLAILHDSPKDAPIDGRTKKPITFLGMLTAQFQQAPPSPSGQAAADEAHSLQTLTILSLLPALVGPSFRRLDDRGISPWIVPFNALVDSASPHVLALSALSWSHLVYSFLRTTSDKAPTWVFNGDAKPFGLLLGLFKNRQAAAWRKIDATDPSGRVPGRKEAQKVHAKALTLALVSFVYGMSVYIRQGVSPVRPSSADLHEAEIDIPLTLKQSEHLDLVFDDSTAQFLPLAAHTGVSQDAPILAWSLFSSILRPRTSNDATKATLEALVNPAFLNGNLSQTLGKDSEKDKEKQALLTARAMASAVQPVKVPGWGAEWVQGRVEKVLKGFERCLPRSEEGVLEQVVQPHYSVAWQNLLRTLSLPSPSPSSGPSPLYKALAWLISSPVSPAVSAALWSATVARSEEVVVHAAGEVLSTHAAALEKATVAWAGQREKDERWAVTLGRGWTAVLGAADNVELSPTQLGLIVGLLRFYASLVSPSSSATDWHSLAHAVNARVWRDDPASHALCAHLASLLTPPSDVASDLRLCALLVAASHDLSIEVQENVQALSDHAVKTLLNSEEAGEDSIALIAKVLEVASDRVFPTLYDLALEQLGSVITHPTDACLSRLVPILAPSLQRASNLTFTLPAAESQFESQALQQSLLSHSYAAHPAHRPFLAFEAFWRKTFGIAKEDLHYPEELVESLAVLRELAEDFPAPNLGESQGTSMEVDAMGPAAGQVAPSRTTLPRTTPSTRPDISSRSYDADHSHFAHDSHTSYEDDDSFAAAAVPQSGGGGRAPSPSLYGIEHVDLPLASSDRAAPEGVEEQHQTQEVVHETPVEVEEMRARASLASLATTERGEEQEMEMEERQEERQSQPRRRSPRTAEMRKGKEKEEKPVKVKKVEKRQRVEPEEITIEDSEDEIIVAVSSSQAVKKAAAPPRKRAKSSKSRRSSAALSSSSGSPSVSASEAAHASPEPSASAAGRPKVPSTKKRSSPPSQVEAPAPKKRKSPTTRSKGKIGPTPPTPPKSSTRNREREREQPAPSQRSSTSPSLSPTTAADQETIRRFFALPIDRAVQLGKDYCPESLRRFMDLGERAKEYFERLGQGSSPSSSSSSSP
ncbi:hypothetical protein JCM11641_005444 [Rhodosporidiobolus odoratus]